MALQGSKSKAATVDQIVDFVRRWSDKDTDRRPGGSASGCSDSDARQTLPFGLSQLEFIEAERILA
jgi:hypothetical protein